MSAASPIPEATRRAIAAVVDSVPSLPPDYRRTLRAVLALPADRLTTMLRAERRTVAMASVEPAQPAADAPLLVTRSEAARLLSRSVRMIDLLAREGILVRCTLPPGGRRGRVEATTRRALGITRESVLRLVRQWSGDGEGRTA